LQCRGTRSVDFAGEVWSSNEELILHRGSINYYQAVPLGQMTFSPAEALIKLALMDNLPKGAGRSDRVEGYGRRTP
jgi:hypothetical protein